MERFLFLVTLFSCLHGGYAFLVDVLMSRCYRVFSWKVAHFSALPLYFPIMYFARYPYLSSCHPLRGVHGRLS